MVQAAAWRTHLTEIGAESTEAFEAWLAADALNRGAWRQVQKPWDLFGEHANSPELLALRRAALGNAHAVARKRWLRGMVHGGNGRRAVIAASIAVIAIGAFAFLSLNRAEVYRTAAGERRVVTLADGSKIALDSQSEVRVDYTQKSRDLTLVHGQARFDVARDIGRPFSVAAGGQKVLALATAFNVDLFGSNVLVTLIEGRVAVLPDADPHPAYDSPLHSNSSPSDGEGGPKGRMRNMDSSSSNPVQREETRNEIILSPGEQLVISPKTLPKIEAVDIERATAWQSGQLVFDNEPLSSVVERVNRYASQTVGVADEQTAALRISGVFNTGDINGFVSTITHYLPIQAETQSGGTIELRVR